MKKRIQKYAPPGMDVDGEILAYASVLVIQIFWCLCFFVSWYMNLMSVMAEVKRHPGKNLYFTMRPLSDFLNHRLFGISILFLVCVCMVILHFRYFHTESKSIYLMRRLPDGRELYRRCLTLPVLVFMLSLIFGLIYIAICMGFYHLFTPDAVKPASDHFSLWRIFL